MRERPRRDAGKRFKREQISHFITFSDLES